MHLERSWKNSLSFARLTPGFSPGSDLNSYSSLFFPQEKAVGLLYRSMITNVFVCLFLVPPRLLIFFLILNLEANTECKTSRLSTIRLVRSEQQNKDGGLSDIFFTV